MILQCKIPDHAVGMGRAVVGNAEVHDFHGELLLGQCGYQVLDEITKTAGLRNLFRLDERIADHGNSVERRLQEMVTVNKAFGVSSNARIVAKIWVGAVDLGISVKPPPDAPVVNVGNGLRLLHLLLLYSLRS